MRTTTTGAAGRRSRALRFVVVPEVASRINGLLAGQFEFICDVPPDQIPTIEQNPKFEVLGGLVVNHRITVFDKHHPQLVDPRVRQAITHAIDRQAIVDSLWVGPHARAAGPAMGILRPDVRRGLDGAGVRSRPRPRRC